MHRKYMIPYKVMFASPLGLLDRGKGNFADDHNKRRFSVLLATPNVLELLGSELAGSFSPFLG